MLGREPRAIKARAHNAVGWTLRSLGMHALPGISAAAMTPGQGGNSAATGSIHCQQRAGPLTGADTRNIRVNIGAYEWVMQGTSFGWRRALTFTGSLGYVPH